MFPLRCGRGSRNLSRQEVEKHSPSNVGATTSTLAYNSSMNAPSESTRWKPITLVSALLLSLCVAFGYIDVLTHFAFDFFTEHYGIVFVIGALSGLCCCISIVGWAVRRGRQGRIWLAISVLFWPWAVLLIGYPFAGMNIHGPAAPLMVLIWPASILSMVLFVMAGVAKKNT